MTPTLDELRNTLNHACLQSTDILLWFKHTALPSRISRGYPHDYKHFQWEQMKERLLTSIIVGFSPMSTQDQYYAGFKPIELRPSIAENIREIRLVRFIPDSGEISLLDATDPETALDVTTLNCKIKSAVIVSRTSLAADEREIAINELFNLQLTMHSRRIEIL